MEDKIMFSLSWAFAGVIAVSIVAGSGHEDAQVVIPDPARVSASAFEYYPAQHVNKGAGAEEHVQAF